MSERSKKEDSALVQRRRRWVDADADPSDPSASREGERLECSVILTCWGSSDQQLLENGARRVSC